MAMAHPWPIRAAATSGDSREESDSGESSSCMSSTDDDDDREQQHSLVETTAAPSATTSSSCDDALPPPPTLVPFFTAFSLIAPRLTAVQQHQRRQQQQRECRRSEAARLSAHAACAPEAQFYVRPLPNRAFDTEAHSTVFFTESVIARSIHVGVYIVDGSHCRCFYLAASRALGVSMKRMRRILETGLRSLCSGLQCNANFGATLLYGCGIETVLRHAIAAGQSSPVPQPDLDQSVENFIHARQRAKWTWGGSDDMQILSLLTGFQIRFVSIDTSTGGKLTRVPHDSVVAAYSHLFQHVPPSDASEPAGAVTTSTYREVFLHFHNAVNPSVGVPNHYDLVIFRDLGGQPGDDSTEPISLPYFVANKNEPVSQRELRATLVRAALLRHAV